MKHSILRLGSLSAMVIAAVGLLTSTTAKAQLPGDCWGFADWYENDIIFDDEGHTSNLAFDPNTAWPDEEWYFESFVEAKYPHVSFYRGSFTMGHPGDSGPYHALCTYN